MGLSLSMARRAPRPDLVLGLTGLARSSWSERDDGATEDEDGADDDDLYRSVVTAIDDEDDRISWCFYGEKLADRWCSNNYCAGMSVDDLRDDLRRPSSSSPSPLVKSLRSYFHIRKTPAPSRDTEATVTGGTSTASSSTGRHQGYFSRGLFYLKIKMPTECIANPLQRELADSIIRMKPLDEIRIMLACGAKPNEPVTQGLRPLHYAVWQRYADAVQLLLVRGADVDATDDCGYSALHLAAEHGHLDLVKLLIAHGARLDHRPDTGELFPRTTMCEEPLRLALKNRHIDIARCLLEAGADANKRYFFGSEINLVSPMDLDSMELLLAFGALPNTRDRAGLTPLMKAARLPQGIASVLLLLSYGADVNGMADARHDFRTVLHYAILGGDPDVINLLLKQGAKLDLGPDYQKPTALDLAILKGDPTIVRMLLDSGANVNATSPIIGSPLHVACAEHIPNRLEIMSMLLERGAEPNLVIRSEEGVALRPVLAEYVASNEEPSVEVVTLLLKYGARVVIKTQFRDPHGILNSLQNAADNPQLLQALLGAAESFDPCMIRRSSSLTDAQRDLVMEAARTPLPLTHQARLIVRRLCGTRLPKVVRRLQLPRTLHRYLLYDLY